MKIVRNINDYRTPFNLVLTRLPVYWEGAIAPKKKKKRSWRTAVFGVLSNRVNLSYTVRQYGQITVTVEKKKPFLFYEKKKPIEILRRHEETAPPARFLAIASKIYTKTNGGGDKGWSGGTGGGRRLTQRSTLSRVSSTQTARTPRRLNSKYIQMYSFRNGPSYLYAVQFSGSTLWRFST